VLLNHSEPKLIKRRMIKNLLLELVQEQANFHNNKETNRYTLNLKLS
jgi:hypothetical protein